MQLKFSNLADLDLEILSFEGNLKFGMKQTSAYLSILYVVLDLVRQHPEMGYIPYPLRFPDMRRTQSGSHIIFYFPHPDYIWVSRIAHKSMDFNTVNFPDSDL